MFIEPKVEAKKLFFSISYAMDLVNSKLRDHQLRTAMIAWLLTEELGYSHIDSEEIFFAALVHDIGAITPEEKIEMHHDLDDANSQRHCLLGEYLLSGINVLRNIGKIVRYHHTPLSILEKERITEKIAVGSNVILLADRVEKMIARDKFVLLQKDEIRDRIKSEKNYYYEGIYKAFAEISETESFWLDIDLKDISFRLNNYTSFNSMVISYENFFNISILVRKIIDFRSRFTATHSTGVSTAAFSIAQNYGFSSRQIEEMKIAGNLHDIGKLSIPNSILEKENTLTPEEFAVVKQHTYHSYSIIKRIGLPIHIAEWAAFHHEKLDGSGYPFHLHDSQISFGSRIMTVADHFTALIEDRPYRRGLSLNETLRIINTSVKKGFLDDKVFDMLEQNSVYIYDAVKAQQNFEYENYRYIQKNFSENSVNWNLIPSISF